LGGELIDIVVEEFVGPYHDIDIGVSRVAHPRVDLFAESENRRSVDSLHFIRTIVLIRRCA